jgi:ATP-dependent protease ClpP protease subunit
MFEFKRIVWMMGTINPDNISRLYDKISGFHEENSEEPIHLYISSSGGSVVGYAFYDFIRGADINLHTYAMAYVDSMAVVLFLAGKKRFVSSHASMTLHQNSSTFNKDTRLPLRELQRTVSEAEMYASFYEDVIHERTEGKMSREEARRLQAEECVLRPSEILKYGLAHEVWPNPNPRHQ